MISTWVSTRAAEFAIIQKNKPFPVHVFSAGAPVSYKNGHLIILVAFFYFLHRINQ